MRKYSVVIVGAGPAGISTWLHLRDYAPDLAADSLVLDRAQFPRAKLCSGGITLPGLRVLTDLRIPLSYRHVAVNEVALRYRQREICTDVKNSLHVVDRFEFDHMLLTTAIQRGLMLRERCVVMSYDAIPEGVRIQTSDGQIEADVVVGADGCGSRIRRSMSPGSVQNFCRTIEVPANSISSRTDQQRCVFDFSFSTEGMLGYRWCFPSVVSNRSIGVFEAKRRLAGGNLLHSLNEAVALYDCVKDGLYRSLPIRVWSPVAPLTAHRVILVGDAAGTEGLLGEGISFALLYGRLAARALAQAFKTGCFGFDDFRRMFLAHSLGRRLRLNQLARQLLYRGWPNTLISTGFGPFWHAVLSIDSHLQEL